MDRRTRRAGARDRRAVGQQRLGEGPKLAGQPGGSAGVVSGVDARPMPLQRIPPLLDPARQRLATTERALTKAARNDLGQPAAKWLALYRRRVP